MARISITESENTRDQGERPVKPLPRHAELAFNIADRMASFLLATFEAKK